MNNTNININNINGGNNKMIIKEKIIPKFRLSNNDTYVKISNIPYKKNTNNKNNRNNFVNRNNSSSNKIFNRQYSFINNKKGIKHVTFLKNYKIYLNFAGDNLTDIYEKLKTVFPRTVHYNKHNFFDAARKLGFVP